MKKIILVSALLAAGISLANPATASERAIPSEITQEEKKVKIELDALPVPVKQTIAGDVTLQALTILEAYKVTRVDETVYFQVGFDNGTRDKVWKSYDTEGKEIKL